MSDAFQEQVEQLVKFTPRGVPYLIFKKEQNPVSELHPRNTPETVPFLFRLDSAAGTVESVAGYEQKGWPVVYSNMPEELVNKSERLLFIYKHLKAHEAYIKKPEPVRDVSEKLRAKRDKDNGGVSE